MTVSEGVHDGGINECESCQNQKLNASSFDFETGRGLEASWAVREGMWRGGGGSGERRGVGGRIGADSRVVGTSVAAR